MNDFWTVDLYYNGQIETMHRFNTKDEALDFYNSKLSACKFGLVGWTVSYPREGGGK